MIAELTVKWRHRLIYGVMQALAPRLKKDVDAAVKMYGNDCPRPFTRMLKKEFGDRALVGCEIGFGFGENAESLLTELNISRLYCVDPYFTSQSYVDTGVVVDWYSRPPDTYFARLERIKQTGKVVFLRETSDNAFKYHTIPRDLDFIYIDGNHTKQFVTNDLFNSMRCVKEGGYVGGHDFANGGLVGVHQAVFEYMLITRHQPDAVYPDFWFRKRGEWET